ncbi:MAG: WYL domain-containing protein [Flavobacteriales bacterium]|nr:WYL domain-containing protein [Flavobacteriales bacterium]MBK6944569.1 WYL domain-containing protein [Flavobacteriales bacterium]MBK7295549.1 WYL domain-containing protein [Flavobacteriales bacterium]MBK9534224.1 WYL domain-containing protein [Flavobacteriales bacterium]MBP9139805.1 WYL domain-containing protein [Flavobacteriales bacterium]
MPNSTKLQRYLQIIERVQQRTSFAELHEYMSSRGFELSPRTLQRDIEQIREDLGVEVAYDREENTYQIVSKTKGTAVLSQLMERAQLIKLFQDQTTVKELPAQLELEGSLKGLSHMPQILRSIREHKEVVLTTRTGKKGKVKEYSIHPVSIREYQSRWFVLGIATQNGRPVSYGLDKVILVVLKSATITAEEVGEVRKRFAQIVGVDATTAKVEKVKVRFVSEVANELRLRPWHHSQREGKRKGDHVTFHWKLRPNKDLIERIIQYGADAQVMEPRSFVKQIRKQLKLAQKQYRK